MYAVIRAGGKQYRVTEGQQLDVERLGATVVARRAGWTTLRDPTGALYCVTDRDPRSGLGR